MAPETPAKPVAGLAAAPTRVLIVDDSAMARALLREMLAQDPGIEVVGEARNGREAVEMAERLRPQLITMDLEMPVMGGLDAIGEIMHQHAVPILVVSSQADSTNAYQAVSRGALEVIAKPEFGVDSARVLADKVKLLAGVRVIRHLRRHTAAAAADTPPVVPIAREGAVEMVAIASSTGGPQALAAILPALPAGLRVPVLIAQHIADGFAEDMARWLDGLTPLSVRMATEGVLPEAGCVYLSPSEQHLLVQPNRRLGFAPRGPADIYKPSCNRLLTSVAEVYGRRSLGVILTGMGSDGVAGIQAIRERGGATLAQDEASSVIYGMNGLAVQSGAVDRELPLEQLAGSILSRVGAAAEA